MPIPPTKPTPPTPPTMNTTSAAPSGEDTHASSPATSNSSNAKKAAPSGNVKTANEAPAANTTKTPAEKANSSATDKETAAPPPPPLGSYKETSSQAPLTPIVSAAAKKSPSSIGFGFLFSLILLSAIAFTCFRLWKNNNKQQRTILDYSTNSPKELLNLMNSSATIPPVPQTLLKKNKTAAKIKGNFEVRI
jgi:hypothetical protein